MSLLRPTVGLDLQSVFPFCNRCDCNAFGLYRCLSSYLFVAQLPGLRHLAAFIYNFPPLFPQIPVKKSGSFV